MRELRRDEEPRGLVRAPGDRDACCSSSRRSSRPRQVKRTEKTLAKARTPRQHVGVLEADSAWSTARREIVDQSPLIVPIERAGAGRRSATQMFDAAARADAGLPWDARVRPARAARAVRADRLRAQGGRRRQRRHARVDRAAARPRRPGSAVPADEGGRGVGARGAPRPQRVHEPRPASGRRAAADAGDQRHLPRLGARRRRARRQAARLLRPPAQGLEGLGGDRADGPGGHGRVRQAVRLDAGARPRPQRRPRSRSPPTSAAATASTARSSSSPGPTRTRTNATTRRSPTPSKSGRIEVQEGL